MGVHVSSIYFGGPRGSHLFSDYQAGTSYRFQPEMTPHIDTSTSTYLTLLPCPIDLTVMKITYSCQHTIPRGMGTNQSSVDSSMACANEKVLAQ